MCFCSWRALGQLRHIQKCPRQFAEKLETKLSHGWGETLRQKTNKQTDCYCRDHTGPIWDSESFAIAFNKNHSWFINPRCQDSLLPTKRVNWVNNTVIAAHHEKVLLPRAYTFLLLIIRNHLNAIYDLRFLSFELQNADVRHH